MGKDKVLPFLPGEGGFSRTDSTTEADTDEAESSASKKAIDSFSASNEAANKRIDFESADTGRLEEKDK